ncbi:MAG: hypothetical protein JNM47_07565 [Hyphomonadaceae bacterium]|nr:hypothetical protein [Hyphomonadaceae bacterium]
MAKEVLMARLSEKWRRYSCRTAQLLLRMRRRRQTPGNLALLDAENAGEAPAVLFQGS